MFCCRAVFFFFFTTLLIFELAERPPQSVPMSSPNSVQFGSVNFRERMARNLQFPAGHGDKVVSEKVRLILQNRKQKHQILPEYK